MRGKPVIFVLTLLAIAASGSTGRAQKARQLDELVVAAGRPLKDIGVQKTDFDSLALKENIALSMADILAFNSSLYVKNSGRASLSTVSFRGTSPSHTQVTWNGMKISNPMLGMMDFSTIPSYFVDRASLLHGTSSVNETGGGMGGLVRLATAPDLSPGLNLQYVQGIGSFLTFDEFLKAGWTDGKWAVSTRLVNMASRNNFKFVNRDKKENIYDSDHNIIGQYYPTERNKSGAYRDFHLLQEVYYNSRKGDRIGLNAWYVNSNRELPLLTTDYGDERDFENRQREQTFRGVLSWDHNRSTWRLNARAGYTYSKVAYDYKREITENNWASLTSARSRINTFFGEAEGEWNPNSKWMFTARLSAYQHLVKSQDKNIILQEGDKGVVGYDKGRLELAAAVSAKWQPIDRLGMSVLLREELYGTRRVPLIPAFFIDGVLTNNGWLAVKASVTRNYRFPSLNDLYFLPGGNPDLKSESGITYDAGLNFHAGKSGVLSFNGSATWFDSYIDDWIIWLPTSKGYFSSRNMKKVHAYGVEISATLGWKPFRDAWLDADASYSWTPSVNKGDKVTANDKSVGKQLPYVPVHSAAVAGRLSWRSWSITYKWCFYSPRYTMSSNENSISGRLPSYFMNNVSLEKNLNLGVAILQLKLVVNNLFDEKYLSILSRPMPGINFEFFVGIIPVFKDKK